MAPPDKHPLPSSLAEVADRLTILTVNQVLVQERLDHILDMLRLMAAEVAGTHQERIDLVIRVATLEHRVALLESKGEKQ